VMTPIREAFTIAVRNVAQGTTGEAVPPASPAARAAP